MFFLHLILLIKGSSICPNRVQDIKSIYTTNGEYLEYPMSDFFLDDLFTYDNNFIYEYDPSIPNVQIKNAFNKISHIDGIV